MLVGFAVPFLAAPVGAQELLPMPAEAADKPVAEAALPVPPLAWIAPFLVLLLAIAVLPLLPATAHWWECNRNKLLVAVLLGLATIAYYFFRGFGFKHAGEAAAPGGETVLAMLHHALLDDYIPFIVLLLTLYIISGGINLQGDIQARPITNTAILGIGAVLASFIGTTGASMVLIRPLLSINAERRHVRHTVIFFIFLVSNIGGCLLPLGDPPLFLGYLRGVPFLWTFTLWKEWLSCTVVVLVIYYIWDCRAYRTEAAKDIALDIAIRKPLVLRGAGNVIWLAGVVAAVALLVPGRPLPGTNLVVAPFLREGVLLFLAGASLSATDESVRQANAFNYHAINEVACLFLGIFITMQVPMEILRASGSLLGLRESWHFFWATGLLSSFLDNAPTYAVFFESAGALDLPDMEQLRGVQTATQTIAVPLLTAVSLGAVFMGANTYIGNAPNFMVKSIAERAGVKMPSFAGYMAYSGLILLPVFVLVTVVFLL